jgi:hypothetical protein
MKIITQHIFPPIPSRNFDWSAVTDDYDGAPDAPVQPIGFGPTEQVAIDNLKEQLQENG